MTYKRDIELSLDLSPEELADLTKRAKEAGLSPQEYVRKKLEDSYKDYQAKFDKASKLVKG